MVKNSSPELTPREQRAAKLAAARKDSAKGQRTQRLGITGIIVAVVVAIIALAAFGINGAAQKNQTNDELVNPTSAAVTEDRGILYTPEDAGFTGDAPEPVKLTLTEDFSCPACKSFEEINGPELNDLVEQGKLAIEYKQISFLDDNGASPNQYSRRATSAAMCVLEGGDVNDWKEVHDGLWAAQPEEGAAGPTTPELAETLMESYPATDEGCILTDRYVPWVAESTKAFYDSDISSTPTGTIDGKNYEAGDIMPALADAIAKNEA